MEKRSDAAGERRVQWARRIGSPAQLTMSCPPNLREFCRAAGRAPWNGAGLGGGGVREFVLQQGTCRWVVGGSCWQRLLYRGRPVPHFPCATKWNSKPLPLFPTRSAQGGKRRARRFDRLQRRARSRESSARLRFVSGAASQPHVTARLENSLFCCLWALIKTCPAPAPRSPLPRPPARSPCHRPAIRRFQTVQPMTLTFRAVRRSLGNRSAHEVWFHTSRMPRLS